MPDYIKIRTAQNVEIKYKLAGFGNRVLAKLVDFIIMFAYSILTVYIFANLELTGLLIYVFLIPMFTYTLLFEIFNGGQTPGKSVLKIKVVSLDGSPLNTGQVLMRWLLQIVDIWLISGLPGLLSVLISDNQQRLGDMSAGTIVVSLKKDSNIGKTAYVKIEKTYLPTYTQASQLSEQDVRIIKSVLTERSDNRFSLMTKAADKIQDLLQIKKTQTSQEFLKTVIKDYNYYQQDTSEEDDLEY